MTGIFYGVGVGPGDPELLTLKAIHTIKKADVIIAPQTEKKSESVALSICRPYIHENTKIVKMKFPMVFCATTLSNAWQENKDIILNFLQEGKKVVFLTLGDPMLYSTYIYVFRLLKDCGYPVHTIPGIPAFCAISSYIGYPMAEGDNIVSILPATADEEVMDKVLAVSDNVVLMKVYKNFKEVIGKLEDNGLLENAVMVSKCGLAGEQIVHNLKEVDEKVNYLSTILTRKCKENSCQK
ncbi:MAG: cbiL [Firmicutes bacterium]|nr:cbiL [Bacillota bacterium]